jgi:hypothetical protein
MTPYPRAVPRLTSAQESELRERIEAFNAPDEMEEAITCHREHLDDGKER